ncbi:MAG: hypothetical protein NXI27_13180 [Alphaproteobacteria bacterium]|nr:hypothetical protein [Alphaproteobacteria bacterium]
MNLTEQHLDTAVSRAIIDADQRSALMALATGDDIARSNTEEEQFRFISGFNDIFLAIGVALFIAAAMMAANLFDYSTLSLAVCALGMWLVSEVLTARLRRAIPSMLAAIAFVGFAVWASTMFVEGLTSALDPQMQNAVSLYGAAIGGCIWASLYLVRFRLPFSVLLVSGAVVWLGFLIVTNVFVGLSSLQEPIYFQQLPASYALASGLVLFGLAMWFDRIDPDRKSLRADYGFWLHLLAAPLIVHAMMYLITGLSFGGLDGGATAGSALLVVGLFAALALVALVINRRAILVAALTYLGGALWYLMSQSERTANNAELLSILLISIFVIGLGVGWHAIRRALIQVPPLDRLDHALFSKQV